MEFLYQFLQKVGFLHPLHPALIHVPIGLIIGAFVFILIALIFKREDYRTTAFRCIVLSLIFLIPSIILGFTDWWHFYAGVWSFMIEVKIVLTAVLVILLVTAVLREMKRKGTLLEKTVVYFLCVLTVAAMGYFGAELIYLGKDSAGSEKQLQAGEKLYAAHCVSCHPRGGNTLNPKVPVIGSSHLRDLNAFVKFNRKPLRPDGSKGVMPAYPEDKVSDQEMALIYNYVTHVLAAKQ